MLTFLCRFRGCLVDEHYYPTLFAMHGRQSETDCKGVLTIAEFRYECNCYLQQSLTGCSHRGSAHFAMLCDSTSAGMLHPQNEGIHPFATSDRQMYVEREVMGIQSHTPQQN